MNITRDFVTWMESKVLATFGSTVYIGSVPQDAPDTCWWVLSSGGNTLSKNNTGEKQKNYIISVFYRSIDAENVYDTLQSFEELVNAKDCVVFTNYDILELQATVYPTDQDIDNEERTVGLVQILLTVYTN